MSPSATRKQPTGESGNADLDGRLSRRRGAFAITPLLVALACVPAVFMFVLMVRYWVNVPFWDQWHFGYALEKSYLHTFTAGTLFEQANESRPFFPYLLFLVLARLTRWDVRAEMLGIFGLACGVSWMILKLLERTKSGSPAARLFALFFANIVLFLPVSYNWLWGIMFLVYVPPLALVIALWANLSEMRARNKILVAAACAVVATFSFSNGLLVWLLAVPLPWLFDKADAKRNRWYLAYGLAFVATVAFYFHGYARPMQHPELANPLTRPLFALDFVLTWFGYPLTVHTVIPAAAMGGALLAIFVCLSIYALSIGRHTGTPRAAYPWIAVGMYAVISGCMVFLGRSGSGMEFAISERYITTSAYLATADILLAFVVYQHCFQSRLSRPARTAVAATAALFGLGLLIPSDGYASVRDNMRALQQRNERIQTALTFINVIPDNPELAMAYPSVPVLRRQMGVFERYNALSFPVFQDALGGQFVQALPVAGSLETCSLSGPDSLHVTGMRPRLDDYVVFAYSAPNGAVVPFSAIRTGGKADFDRTLSVENVTAGHVHISAWAVTADGRNPRRLASACEIEVAAER